MGKLQLWYVQRLWDRIENYDKSIKKFEGFLKSTKQWKEDAIASFQEEVHKLSKEEFEQFKKKLVGELNVEFN